MTRISQPAGNSTERWLTCGCLTQNTRARCYGWSSGLMFCIISTSRKALIEAAAKSNPQGFLPFEDLPDQALRGDGCAEQSTSEPSTE